MKSTHVFTMIKKEGTAYRTNKVVFFDKERKRTLPLEGVYVYYLDGAGTGRVWLVKLSGGFLRLIELDRK